MFWRHQAIPRRRAMISRMVISVCATICFVPYFSAAQRALSPTDQQAAATDERRFDGPAELPRLQAHSAMADTPARGRTRQVQEGEDLQAAINDIHCGDTLKLQAGATFSGVFRFPNKSCDDAHWIIVRTSAPDDNLPREGTRMTPCYAGIVSLPGRPDFHCASPRNVLAKIELDRKAEAGPILFLDGANHYRFVGLEITRAVPQLHLRNLIQPKDLGTTAHHLVFDRLWLHGTPQDETKGGIHLSGTTNVAIVDSYFSDFHCIAFKGSCTDAQAINGGGGNAPGGPYKIEDNFLEASGQSIMFGGAPGTSTPADIEIRRNHLFKPMVWKPGEPEFLAAYTGDPFIVKNHFELKNAQRVLFEDNVLENCWGGFTQTGFSILLNPGNQSGLCPQCRVTDITIRYNKIAHVASAVQIGNIPAKEKGPAAEGERYSIHDLVVDDIDPQKYKGFGLFATIVDIAPPLQEVRIDHVTAFPSRAILTIINVTGAKIPGVSITNSIFTAGNRQIASAGGGPRNCASQPGGQGPAGVLDSCFSNFSFTHNLIIDGTGKWPSGNVQAKNERAAGLVDFGNGRGGDYRLCRAKSESTSCERPSSAMHAGTDGKDIGADLEAIEKAVAGVI